MDHQVHSDSSYIASIPIHRTFFDDDQPNAGENVTLHYFNVDRLDVLWRIPAVAALP